MGSKYTLDSAYNEFGHKKYPVIQRPVSLHNSVRDGTVIILLQE